MAQRISCCGILLVCVGLLTATGRSDIFRWDNLQLIPGTEGITPGPGVQLVHRELNYARLPELDLTGANFELSNLTNATFYRATLRDANLTAANLTGAFLVDSTLTNANLTGAVVGGTNFRGTTARGFTQRQLQSTASYQAKDLRGTVFEGNDLTGWDFSDQDLTAASLFFATLTNANLNGAVVSGADLGGTSLLGFTQAQLQSTASYQANDLRGIRLAGNNLIGWDLSGQNLAGADLFFTWLTNVDLTDTVVRGTNFEFTTTRGFTQRQLQSTASYQAKDLQGIGLRENDLTGWDFSGQNLAGANLTVATLTNANLTGAVVGGTDFSNTTSHGFTQAQLQSTASYRANDLQGIGLATNDLSGWDFSGQNLTGANLSSATLANAKLTGANLKNAYLMGAIGLSSASFDAASVYNAWTWFPDGFDPSAAGLTLAMSLAGDLDADDVFDADDVDMLAERIIYGKIPTWWLQDAAFNLNGDGIISLEDHRVWVRELKRTWYGDANLDFEFNSGDLVHVLAAGRYEAGKRDFTDHIIDPAGWSEGDWNADGEFNSSDLVTALADGGYEQGPRPPAAAFVPEPSSQLLIAGLLPLLWMRGRSAPFAEDHVARFDQNDRGILLGDNAYDRWG